jgi:hypothetical protein
MGHGNAHAKHREARLRAVIPPRGGAGAGGFDKNADPTTVTDAAAVSALPAGKLMTVPVGGFVIR